MAYNDPLVAAASAARTTTGNSGPLIADRGDFLDVVIDVTAASGTTPSLTLSVEWSMDGGVTFATPDGAADAFTALTAAGVKVKQFALKAPHYRLVWTISGTTPSFTFSLRTWATT